MMDWTTEGVWLHICKIVLCLWPGPRGADSKDNNTIVNNAIKSQDQLSVSIISMLSYRCLPLSLQGVYMYNIFLPFYIARYIIIIINSSLEFGKDSRPFCDSCIILTHPP